MPREGKVVLDVFSTIAIDVEFEQETEESTIYDSVDKETIDTGFTYKNKIEKEIHVNYTIELEDNKRHNEWKIVDINDGENLVLDSNEQY